MARRSLQAVDWATLFREWRASGLTQPEFCRRRDIPLHTFRRRLYHPAAKNGAGDASSPRAAPPETGPPSCTPSPRFIPVRVVAEDQPVPEAVIPSTPGRPVEIGRAHV